MEPYKTFLVPFDSNKLNLFMRNNALTQKTTNAPHFISQSDPPASKEILVPKMRTDISILSGATGASITPGKLITGKKRKLKSLATSPPRKDSVTNQDKNSLWIKKYQSLPPNVPKFPPRF